MKTIKIIISQFKNYFKTKYKKQSYRILNDVSTYSESEKYKGFENAIMINIGAGCFSHPNCINLDLDSQWYKTNELDKNFKHYNIIERNRIPFENEEVSIVYTSHTIEHVDSESVLHMFKEVNRILKRGGIFRITCPNVDLFYNSALIDDKSIYGWRKEWFINRQASYREWEEISPLDILIREVASIRSPWIVNEFKFPIKEKIKIDLLLNHADVIDKFNNKNKEDFLDWLIEPLEFDPEIPGVHMNWWNHAKLNKILTKSGFKHIIPGSFGTSLTSPMRDIRYFDNTNTHSSLYIEALKL